MKVFKDANNNQTSGTISREVTETLEFSLPRIRNDKFDFKYNDDQCDVVTEKLIELGWGDLAQLFYDEKIDDDIFKIMGKTEVYEVMREYPVGIRMKFYQDLIKSRKSSDDVGSDSPHIEIVEASQEIATTSYQSSIDTVNVREILATEAGKKFLQSLHTRDDALSLSEQRKLCSLIIESISAKGLKPRKNDFKRLAAEIAVELKGEDPASYFIDGHQAKGMLYKRFYNVQTLLNKSKGVKGKKRKLESSSEIESQSQLQDDIFDDDEIMANDFILANPFINMQELLPYWSKSYRIRQSFIKSSTFRDIISYYVSYDRADGYALIHNDFISYFSDENFERKFLQIMPKLLNFLKMNVVNAGIKEKLITCGEKGLTEEVVAVLMGLHAYLYESGKSKKGESKPTIMSSIKYMLFLTNNNQSLQSDIDDWVRELSDLKLDYQPTIICFGDDYDNLETTFTVLCDNLAYKFASILKALESLIHIYIVFDLKWPLANQNVYKVIYKIIYDLQDSRDEMSSPTIKSLLKAINKEN